MTTVYRIKNDVDHFQYFLTEKLEDYVKLEMDCTPKVDSWLPPSVFIYKPRHRKGDFFNTTSDSLIASPKATEVLRWQFERAGELLPLPYENEVFTVLNVTECINCLDQEKTEREYAKASDTKLWIKKYAFHHDRFSSTIFKIPETCMSEILIVEGLRGPEDEFKHTVEAAGLQGLIFEKVWEEQF